MLKYRFNFIVLVFLLSTIYSYSQIQVIPVADNSFELKSGSQVYCLPRTSFEICISVTTEKLIPGPYSKYAEKYLSIRNVKTAEETNYYIDTIEVKEQTSSDPSASFLVTGGVENKIVCSSDGIILAYNIPGHQQVGLETLDVFSTTNTTTLGLPAFFNYGVKPNFINNTDTTYKVVEVDSVFQKIPVYNKVIISKDDEMKAEEAANYILTLRNCLFKVLSGDFDTDNPPSEIEFMANELKRLEAEYLSLFLGKIEKSTRKYLFYYTPEAGFTEKSVPLCYFEDGKLIAKSQKKSTPVMLKLTNSLVARNIEDFYERNSKGMKEKTFGLYYRVPSLVGLTIEYEGFVYYANQFLIPQCGYVSHLPAKMFKDKELGLEFDAKYGTIKKRIVK